MMYLLLPPSEGKLPSARTPGRKRLPRAIAADTAPVLDHLRGLSERDRMSFYGVKDAAKAQAMDTLNRAVLTTPALPAIERYTGVVYANLDCATLEEPGWAADRILIVSGLFGLIRGSTPIPDYKLPLNPWLTRYWKPINERRIARFTRNAPVVSLLPIAHAKAVPYEPLLHIDFRLSGGRISAGHFGKAIKGKFVRWVLENKVVDPAQFVEFTEKGYQFNGKEFVQF
jgi:cytoplasmic iron level regulating protein YaaA (DUF328/UPF0246 family)